jgi:Flp pilus assembly protein TadD
MVRGLLEHASESACAVPVRCYSETRFSMIFRVLLVATAVAAIASAPRATEAAGSPSGATSRTAPGEGVASEGAAPSEDARSDAKEQVEFGIKVAQNGLWKEAAYRWEKAVQLDPTYGAAWNNLAIAYEQQGNFEKAREAYEKACELEPKNLLFRQNYDLFKEINDRAKRRRDR